jgi:hypothetical protein
MMRPEHQSRAARRPRGGTDVAQADGFRDEAVVPCTTG